MGIEELICHQCNYTYRRGFLHSHNQSTRHKQAILDISHSQSDHPIYGRLVMDSNGGNNVEFLFSGYDDYRSLLRNYELENSSSSSSTHNIPSSYSFDKNLEFKEKIAKDLEEVSAFIKFYKEGILFRINQALMKHKNVKINLKLNTVIYKIPLDGSNILYQYYGLITKGK